MHTLLCTSFSYPAVFPIKTFITKEHAPEGNIQSDFILMGMEHAFRRMMKKSWCANLESEKFIMHIYIQIMSCLD